MQLAQVHGFLAVAREGGVSRAADTLGITQPALTARLHALEEELGQRLLVRSGRGVRLTDAGRAFLPYAEQAFEALARGMTEVSEIAHGAAGELVLAVAPAVSTYVLPHVLVPFAQRYPRARLIVRTGHSEEIIEMVVRGAVHAGLGRLVHHSLVDSRPVFDEELVLVSRPDHPIAGRGAVQRSALGEAPLILFDRSSSYYELTTTLVREAGVRPRGMIELDNIEAAKRMVGAGLGLALLPRTSVFEELESGALVALAIEGGSVGRRHIVIARRRDAGPPTPLVGAFLELLARVPDVVPGALAPAGPEVQQLGLAQSV
ncbi:LysR family transcriptional regulator [soil metagenome]